MDLQDHPKMTLRQNTLWYNYVRALVQRKLTKEKEGAIFKIHVARLIAIGHSARTMFWTRLARIFPAGEAGLRRLEIAARSTADARVRSEKKTPGKLFFFSGERAHVCTAGRVYTRLIMHGISGILRRALRRRTFINIGKYPSRRDRDDRGCP